MNGTCRVVCFAVVAVSLSFSLGCTQVQVSKVKCSSDPGFRYYRPKPYLFVTGAIQNPPSNMEQRTASQMQQAGTTSMASSRRQASLVGYQENQGSDTRISDQPDLDSDLQPHGNSQQSASGTMGEQRRGPQAISMSLQYLPDFAEEYAINFRPGLGSGQLNLTLENGWNLTSVGITTDQQTDEIIGSVASALSSAGSAFRFGSQNAPQTVGHSTQPDMYGSNVPFGFYEAVIATGPNGKKQLYGWRYVGFMPFQSCPIETGGGQQSCCNSGDIFGMVFVNGVMQFQRIAELPTSPVDEDGVARNVVSSFPSN